MVTKWELTGLVKASKYRSLILERLAEKDYLPKDLEKETGIKFSHVSRTLKELEQWKLIKCKNPKLKKGKIYKATRLGKDIVKNI